MTESSTPNPSDPKEDSPKKLKLSFNRPNAANEDENPNTNPNIEKPVEEGSSQSAPRKLSFTKKLESGSPGFKKTDNSESSSKPAKPKISLNLSEGDELQSDSSQTSQPKTDSPKETKSPSLLSTLKQHKESPSESEKIKIKLGLQNRPPVSKYTKEAPQPAPAESTPSPKPAQTFDFPPPPKKAKTQPQEIPSEAKESPKDLPEQPPFPPKKSKAPILIALLLLLVASAGAYYFFFMKPKEAEPIVPPTPSSQTTQASEPATAQPFNVAPIEENPQSATPTEKILTPETIAQPQTSLEAESINIQMVKEFGERKGIFMNNVFYAIGDIIDPKTDLRLLQINPTNRTVTFLNNKNQEITVSY